MLTALQEDLSLVPNTQGWQLTITCNSSIRGFDTFFWPRWAPAWMWYTDRQASMRTYTQIVSKMRGGNFKDFIRYRMIMRTRNRKPESPSMALLRTCGLRPVEPYWTKIPRDKVKNILSQGHLPKFYLNFSPRPSTEGIFLHLTLATSQVNNTTWAVPNMLHIQGGLHKNSLHVFSTAVLVVSRVTFPFYLKWGKWNSTNNSFK